MTHPLTDDIIESELATPAHFTSGSLVGLFTHDDMRVAYNKGCNDQLEKVIEWLNEAISDQCIIWPHQIDALPRRLQKAMRPQQQEES